MLGISVHQAGKPIALLVIIALMVLQNPAHVQRELFK